MWFELFVALRYLKAKHKTAAISIISVIIVFGIFVGVFVLIVTLAILTGFKEEFQSKLLGASSHIRVLKEDGSGIKNYTDIMDQLRKIPRILAVAPTIYDQAFLTGNTGSFGVNLKGIDPRLERNVSDLLNYIVIGSAYDLLSKDSSEAEEKSLEGVVLGRELAKNLGVGVGDVLTLISPKGSLSPFGLSPKVKKLRVVSIFQSGLWDQDATWAYTSIPMARNLASIAEDQVTVIECKVDNIYEVKEISNSIKENLKGLNLSIVTWKDLYKPLFSFMKLEKLIGFVITALLILVASSSVLIILIMLVLEKRRDIAILSAMGATEKTVMLVFVLQGLILGIIGTSLGGLFGYLACWGLDKYKLIQLPPEIYSISYLPFKVKTLDFILVIFFSIVVSLLATVYPARSAARIDPVNVLRYE